LGSSVAADSRNGIGVQAGFTCAEVKELGGVYRILSRCQGSD
jgi:ribosomal protein S5